MKYRTTQQIICKNFKHRESEHGCGNFLARGTKASEGQKNVASWEPAYKEPDTLADNQSSGHSEQKTIDMSECSDPSKAHPARTT